MPDRHRLWALLRTIALLWMTVSTVPLQAQPLSLQEAIETALGANPSLAELRSRAEAAAYVPEQAGSLPDPVVSLNVASLPTDSFDLEQEAMTQLQVGISQRLPWPGKRDLGRRIAEAAVMENRHALAEARLMMARDVRRSWWQLFFIDRAIENIEDNQQRLRQFVQVAQSKYRVGEGLQQDVLLAEVELSGQLQQRITLTGQRASEQARLNGLMNRRTAEPIQLPVGAPSPVPEPPPLPSLLEEAERARPLLASRQSAMAGAADRLELARKGNYPDFNLVGVYGFRSGNNPDGSSRSDLLTLGVNFTVPLYQASKQNRAVDQRGSELQQRRYAVDDSRRRIAEEIERTLADLAQAREEARLLKEGIVPQTEQAVAALLAGYRVDKVDFSNLIKNQIRLNGYRTAYWRAFTRSHQAGATLDATIGKEQY